LAIAIMGLVLVAIPSVLVLPMAIAARRRILASGGTIGGLGRATAAMIIGIVGAVFLVLALIGLLTQAQGGV
jgi:hypothetical protein